MLFIKKLSDYIDFPPEWLTFRMRIVYSAKSQLPASKNSNMVKKWMWDGESQREEKPEKLNTGTSKKKKNWMLALHRIKEVNNFNISFFCVLFCGWF